MIGSGDAKRTLADVLGAERGLTTTEYLVMLLIIAIAVATLASGFSSESSTVFSGLARVFGSAS